MTIQEVIAKFKERAGENPDFREIVEMIKKLKAEAENTDKPAE